MGNSLGTLLRGLEFRLTSGLYAFANGELEFLRRLLWPRKRPGKAARICLYRVGNIGDVTCAVPAMVSVRKAYPTAAITLLTSPGRRGMPGAKDLLDGADWLDAIWVYYADEVDTFWKRLGFLRRLQKASFDLWIELPNDLASVWMSLRNMCLARCAGAKWAYGWRINTIRWGAQAQSERRTFPGEVDRLIRILACAGIQTPAVVFPLPLLQQRRSIDTLLEKRGLKQQALAAVAPGAKRPLNRWPIERFAEVVHHLAQKGFFVLALGGEPDRELCQQAVRGMNRDALSLAGDVSLLETCELLRRCRLLVSNDSGVQHLAVAVGTPCVSVFSFWQLRGKWHPYGVPHRVLQKWVPCHTCFLENCPYDNKCIKLNTVQEVRECVDQLLEESKTVPPSPDHEFQGSKASS